MTDLETEEQRKAGWVGRLSTGLGRSSAKLSGGITELLRKRRLDDETLEQLEELLISADLGVDTATRLSTALARRRFADSDAEDSIRQALADDIAAILKPVARTISIHQAHKPHVVLFCGVNGSGKTTTIAKFARLFRAAKLKVMIAACDTFRAAAIEQLQVWGDRVGCPVLTRPQGADPASLAFDAMQLAKAEKADVLMIDTAGRLQNKADLMAELSKIVRVLKKHDEKAPHDCVLVIDSTVGQNAHRQVEVFRDLVNVTGLVVTKLDGSARGGVVVALAERFGLPVYAVGVGEGFDDMQAFDADAFARSLLGLPT